jgi:hypothetical protein
MGAFILYWLSKVLVGLFFIGLVGSAVVVIITFFEDGQLLLEGDEPAIKQADQEAIPKNAREAF